MCDVLIITAFLTYMASHWSLHECSVIFGERDTHIWGKWTDCGRDAAAFFLSLDDAYRTALVRRAMQREKEMFPRISLERTREAMRRLMKEDIKWPDNKRYK